MMTGLVLAIHGILQLHANRRRSRCAYRHRARIGWKRFLWPESRSARPPKSIQASVN